MAPFIIHKNKLWSSLKKLQMFKKLAVSHKNIFLCVSVVTIVGSRTFISKDAPTMNDIN